MAKKAMAVRRTLIVLLICIVILPFVVFGRGQPRPDGRRAVDLSNLQLYRVEEGSVALTVSALGSLEPAGVIQLNFLTAGRVQRVNVSAQDYVLAGDVLAELDNTAQRLAYEQAVINVDIARLELEELLVEDPDQVRIAEANVDAAWGAYIGISNTVTDADRTAAELAYQQALSAVETARIERDRIGGQFGGDSNQWLQADARLGEATFNAEIARLQINALDSRVAPQLNNAYQRVLQAQRELDRVKAGPTEAEINAAEIAIERAEDQLDRAQLVYDRTILTAPFDGVVSQLNIEAGAIAVPGSPAIEITAIYPLQMVAQVDEIDIALVEIGMPVRVTLDALPEVTLPAEVTSIAPIGVNEAGIVNYDVEIELTGENPVARAGMTAEATMIVEEVESTLFVPNLYIRVDRRTEQAFVNVLQEDNTVIEVPVTLGLQGRDISEITSGLSAGDLVVIDLSGGGLSTFLEN